MGSARRMGRRTPHSVPMWLGTAAGLVQGDLVDAVGVGQRGTGEGGHDRGIREDIGVVLADVTQTDTVLSPVGRVRSTSRKGRGGVGERERAAVVEDSRTGLDSAGLHNVEAPVTT